VAGPLYRQIADMLRREIESGALKAGMQVPTEDQLMASFRASRNTVRGALNELTTRGLVYKQHGKGTFVSERVRPIDITLTSDPETGRGGGEGRVYTAEVAASGRSPDISHREVGVRQAGSVIARSLQIPVGTEVIFRHENGTVDGVPWSRQTSYYPRSLEARARRLLSTDNIDEGVVAYLAALGIQQLGYQDAIEWRGPNETEITYFDLPADGHIQVVETRRIAFDQDGHRLRLTITVYRADRNRFVVNVGKVPLSAMGPSTTAQAPGAAPAGTADLG
jgi:GntR family transcriptional regulator